MACPPLPLPQKEIVRIVCGSKLSSGLSLLTNEGKMMCGSHKVVCFDTVNV